MGTAVLKTKMKMTIKTRAQGDPSLWGFLIRSSDIISTSEMKKQEEERPRCSFIRRGDLVLLLLLFLLFFFMFERDVSPPLTVTNLMSCEDLFYPVFVKIFMLLVFPALEETSDPFLKFY